MLTAIDHKIKEKNLSFYDAIAGNYEALLEQHDYNRIIRKRVADLFCNHVKRAPVLDFGGGTGLDLKSLSGNYDGIIFCEPSVAMREKAILANKKNKNIIFLNGPETDFTQWNSQFPFEKKLNGILANFAVINCIAEIESLFKHFAEVMNPNGHLIALILDYDTMKAAQLNFLNTIKNILFNKTALKKVKYKDFEHTVFLYSLKEIKRASEVYFDLQHIYPLTEYGFNLIHLTRK